MHRYSPYSERYKILKFKTEVNTLLSWAVFKADAILYEECPPSLQLIF